MLTPRKHQHPDLTLLATAAVLLKRLRRIKVERYQQLHDMMTEYHPFAGPLFVPAVSLLFGLGLVEYRLKSDSFHYLGPR